MELDEVIQFILRSFTDVETEPAYGYEMFYVGPERMLPFATIATDDQEFDDVSNLRREGVYRLNIGVRPETYTRLFGPRPPKAGPSGVVDTGHDFTTLDAVLPHPTYAPQSWVCVLAPTRAHFDAEITALLTEAHAIALERHARARSRG